MRGAWFIVFWQVDHLNLAEVGLLQELQHFQIVALDVEVIAVKTAGRAVPADALRHHGAQRGRDGRVRRQHCLFLVRPSKLVTFFLALNHLDRDFLHQYILINSTNDLAVLIDYLGHSIGEHSRQCSEIFIGFVRRLHLQLIHEFLPPL